MGKSFAKIRATRDVEGGRGIEHGIRIDVESDQALRLMGADDPTSVRSTFQEIKGGRKGVWGPQGDPDGSSPESDGFPEADSEDGHEPPEEIDGWPLDPSRYAEDGSIIGGDANGNGHVEGTYKGLDYRGLVPGAIPAFKIDRVPEAMPERLNIP